MRVVSSVLVLICLCGAGQSAQAQSFKIPEVIFGKGVEFYQPSSGMLNVESVPRTAGRFSLFSVKKAPMFTGPDGQSPVYYDGMLVGKSKSLQVNSPLKPGQVILVKGESLTMNSVNVSVVDVEGVNIPYKEASVIFNELEQQLKLDLNLPSGIYVINIPVLDGIVSKTVIVF